MPGFELFGEEEKKQVHKRYSNAVLNLSKAFALAASSDEAKTIRDEVGFFQAIRAALVKSGGNIGSDRKNEFAVQQIISNAVISTDIIDILKAAGVDSQDISILSDDFLNEMKGMKKKLTSAKTARDPNSRINKSLRKWKC